MEALFQKKATRVNFFKVLSKNNLPNRLMSKNRILSGTLKFMQTY